MVEVVFVGADRLLLRGRWVPAGSGVLGVFVSCRSWRSALWVAFRVLIAGGRVVELRCVDGFDVDRWGDRNRLAARLEQLAASQVLGVQSRVDVDTAARLLREWGEGGVDGG